MEDDQYGMGDLRQYMNGRLLFHGIQQTSQDDDLCLNPSHPSYDMLLFRLDNTTNYNNNNSSSSAAAATTSTYHHRMTTVHGNNSSDGGNKIQHHVLESVNLSGDVNNNNNGRWPRQETITLLEIRSRLDSKFKEANQKGPLWEELSRIMAEEHGYQRSGKKCREKFENLYKYYKKTKEGKAGRQDGKHYRFFRQLEALYGEAQNSTNSTSEAHFVGGNFHYNTGIDPLAAGKQDTPQRHNKLSDTSLSLSNYSESETTSSEDDCDLNLDKKDPTVKKLPIGKKKSWKVKINDFMDAQMKKLMAKQEAWMEKMVKTIEQKEQERMIREEEWRKKDNARIEREHKFWANERAWIEARDSALMDALHKISGNNKDHHFILRASSPHQEDNGSGETMNNINKSDKRDIWPECEISRLIQLRNAMEVRFQRRLVSDDVLWEEIANKMACFGHDRSGLTCKDKWDSVNNYVIKCNKRRKENSPSSSKSCTDAYYHSLHHDESFSNQGGESLSYCNEQRADHVMRLNKYLVNIPSTSPNNADNNVSESSFRFFMGDDYGRNDGLVERSYNQRFNI